MTVFADLIEATAHLLDSLKDSSAPGHTQQQNSFITDVTVRSLSAHLPECFTFANLVETVEALKEENPRISLTVVLVCLKNQEKIQQGPDDYEHQRSLSDHAATLIAPCATDAGGQDSVDETLDYDEVARRSRELAPCGLQILQILSDEFRVSFCDDTLLTVISFADTYWQGSCTEQQTTRHFSWTTEEMSKVARQVLKWQFSQRLPLENVLVSTVLLGYLRPLFSKSKSKAITASGRKAEFPDEDDAHRGLQDDTVEIKAWKFADHRAIAVVQWTVQSAERSLLSKHWPLFIPVLLSLLDDGATRVRSRGLWLLKIFLEKLPGEILCDTGLASVFEDAVFPTLHFLPKITPQTESVELLRGAYTALRTLAGKVNARVRPGTDTSTTPRARLLDKIIREGVFSAYSHVREYPVIMEILLQQAGHLVQDMGIYAVKHLKDLIPMQSEIMTNPFATATPGTLQMATWSLQQIILNCWPRLSMKASFYQDEIIKTLAICFLNLHDDKAEADEELGLVKSSLIRTASVFYNAAKNGGGEGTGLKDKVALLIAKEPMLAELFQDV